MFVCQDCGETRKPTAPEAKGNHAGCCDKCRAERRRRRNEKYYEANKLKLAQASKAKRRAEKQSPAISDLDRAVATFTALLAEPRIRAALREALRED
jgi:hypothetical protein